MNNHQFPLKITRILIANRSEIAARIIQTCRSLGIQTVAVYAPEDAQMPYVYQADEAIALSKNGITGYLDAELLVTIALQTNCDAVHPGYGFLSEKEHFARAVTQAGIIWIGPHANAIEQAGNKSGAHTFAKSLGIPVAEGASFISTQLDKAQQFAQIIGYPIILKCALGGGGKAMRIAHTEEEFYDAWEIVARESMRFFATDQILLEKYIPKARHIEVQIAGDGKNVIHLFERECSVQRRNQKIIEETPCTFVSQKTLDKLYDASIKLGQALAYNNVGTVEFMVTAQENFYFLEINTRLQVEHAVTEITTGIDLVWLQLFLAEHKKLPFKQSQITQHGHAIQARIYAEDATQNFMPSSGTLSVVNFANHPFVRVDHSLVPQTNITPLFDPMIAKLIAYGATRECTRKNLIAALTKTALHGIITNIDFLKVILAEEYFIVGDMFTAQLSDKKFLQTLLSKLSTDNEQELEALAIELIKIYEQQHTVTTTSEPSNNWKRQTWN